MLRNYNQNLPRYVASAAIAAITLLIAFFPVPTHAQVQVSVTTERNDPSRTGANLDETILNTSNVNVHHFGKWYSYTVDASVYAQPLYVPNVVIPGQGTYNVLYVATMNDTVYAFNADSNAVNGGVLWSVNFTNPSAGVKAISITDLFGSDKLHIIRNVG